MIATNDAGYFFDNSLFFPDRESVLVFGGVDPHEEYGRPGNTGKDIYRFKPDQNIWEFVGEIPRARHHHSVAYLRGRIYIVGESNGWRNRGVCKKKERKKKAKQQGFSFHLRIAFKLKKKKRLLPYIIFFTALFSKPRKKICRSSYCAIFFVKERFKDLCWQKEREREREDQKKEERNIFHQVEPIPWKTNFIGKASRLEAFGVTIQLPGLGSMNLACWQLGRTSDWWSATGKCTR